MTVRRPLHSPWALAVILGLTASVVSVLTAAPAGAAVTSLSPATVTIDPGGAATSTVSVNSDGVSCLTVRPSSADLDAGASPPCGAGDNWKSTLSVRVADDTPPGSYSVRIFDQEGGDATGRSLTVRVRDTTPPPPPPPTTTASTTTTTTTTTPPTTTSTTATTRPTTSSTVASTTITTTTTSTSTPSTTTSTLRDAANANAKAVFAELPALVKAGLPDDGVFLPLLDPAFRSCLPLTVPCAANGIVIVPARTTSVVWTPTSTSTPLDPSPASPLFAVGTPPADALSLRYRLPVLDLRSSAAMETALLRTFDARGRLGFTTAPSPSADASTAQDSPPIVVAGAVGPLVGIGPSASAPSAAAAPGATSPFGRPSAVRASKFTEAAPALVLFPGPDSRVIQGIRPDPSWQAGIDLLPLATDHALPYLVRAIDGPPGLFLARPADMRVLRQVDVTGTTPATDRSRSPMVVVAAVGGVAAALTAAAVFFRRRRGRSQ